MCANLFFYISEVYKTELIRNIVGNMGPVRKETSESNAFGLGISSNSPDWPQAYWEGVPRAKHALPACH